MTPVASGGGAASPAPVRVPLERARAFWVSRQGLAASQQGTLGEVVARTGWLRTLGGVDAYLALRARVPGLPRQAADAASEALALRVLPAVRNCIYLVPAVHADLALATAAAAFRPRTEREVEKAGATWAEVEACAAAVLEQLGEPATTDALRRLLPPGTVRSLGEAGKKVGLSSVLPAALRHLELSGRVERTLEGGRLDTERYLWRRAAGPAPSGALFAEDAAARDSELLRLFLSWSGPATLKEFAAWSGVSSRDAAAASRLLDLRAVAVEEHAPDALVLAADLPALLEAPQPRGARLLSFEESLLVAHGGPRLLAAPEDHGRPLDAWGTAKASTLGTATHVSQRTVLVDGRVAGYWELDADAGRVVTGLFRPLPPRARDEVAALAESTARFLLEQVGHARSFSLDTDEGVRRRARAVAAM